MAAILRDPYPIHWDRDAAATLGHGDRVVNQGPLSLSYIINMLLGWAGPTSLRRLESAFRRPVFDGDVVTAKGVVTELTDSGGELLATCDVWLDRDGERVVTGTAVIAIAR